MFLKKTSGIIGGRSAEEAREQNAERLSPCPCGNDAVWYRTRQAVPTMERGRAVSDITADSINENLCDGCFRGLIPEEKRDQWTRLETEHRMNQDTRRGFGEFDDLRNADWD